jgi:hypothetical protein
MVYLSKKAIDHGSIDVVMTTDASFLGWGASKGQTSVGGRWFADEQQHHISFLELKAVLLGLQSLCSMLSNCHTKVLTDNTTAVAYIRNMGSTLSLLCNSMAREIWQWCKARGIWHCFTHTKC